MKCCPDTLYARYSESIKKGHQVWNGSLRRAQYEAAMKGNATMLIWLGKQYLGQRDSPDLSEASTEELLTRARE